MFPDIQKRIEKHDHVASVIAPGPSHQIKSLRHLCRGFQLSVNNSESTYYQFLCDDHNHVGCIGLHPNIYKPSHQPTETFSVVQHNESPEAYFDDAVNLRYPTAAMAVSLLVMHGADMIYIIGQDYCNPYSDRRNVLVTDGLDMMDTHASLEEKNHQYKTYQKSLDTKKGLAQQCYSWLNDVKGIRIINLSPFVELEGTRRIYEAKYIE